MSALLVLFEYKEGQPAVSLISSFTFIAAVHFRVTGLWNNDSLCNYAVCVCVCVLCVRCSGALMEKPLSSGRAALEERKGLVEVNGFCIDVTWMLIVFCKPPFSCYFCTRFRRVYLLLAKYLDLLVKISCISNNVVCCIHFSVFVTLIILKGCNAKSPELFNRGSIGTS